MVELDDSVWAALPFLLCALLMLFFWFFAIIEGLGVAAFWGFFFRLGVPFFHFKERIKLKAAAFSFKPGEVIDEATGKFKFTGDNKVYFRARSHWRDYYKYSWNDIRRVGTPFALKVSGVINPEKHYIDLVARPFMGTTLFFFFWLLGWTVGPIGFAVHERDLMWLPVLLFGWLVGGIICYVSYRVETRRLEEMIRELKKIFHKRREENQIEILY